MERCIRSARAAGVFKEFHVLSDRQLAGCECYDALECDKAGGLFKLHYLKAGMSRLPFDYFIWLDADTVFVRNPVDVLGVLGRSPIHVPLEAKLDTAPEDARCGATPCAVLRDLFHEAGMENRAYLSQSAFWIVHREAIDAVYEEAFQFWNQAKRKGVQLDVNAALGFAMQIFCAAPEAHLLSVRPEVWASDDLDYFAGAEPKGQSWPCRHPLSNEAVVVNPAIIHLPRDKRRRVIAAAAQDYCAKAPGAVGSSQEAANPV
jgi:hypothetical protein